MPRKRKKVFGKRAASKGTTGILINDEVTPFMIIAATNFPKELDRAIRHVGFEVHDATKRYVRSEGHGNPLSEIQENRMIDRAKARGSRLRKKKYAGDLNNSGKSLEKAIRYEHKKGSMKAIVGFASQDARTGTGKAFQEGLIRTKGGFRRQVMVTPKMKRFFYLAAQGTRGASRRKLLAWAGLPVGTVIRNKPRPIFDPVYARLQSAIPRLLEKRVERNLNLLDEVSYQAILLEETGVNDNVREAEKTARKGRRRVS